MIRLLHDVNYRSQTKEDYIMAYNGFAIDEYLDAAEVTRQLDELKKKPIYSIKPEKLKEYEVEYFDKKCPKSKEMIAEAKNYIPGGVQHNLAFNYPFPIVITKAEGNKLYDIDGNWYYDLLQAGGPTILGSNDPVVKEAVTLNYGAFIQSIIDFLLVALSIFIVLRIIMKSKEKLESLKKKEEEAKSLREEAARKRNEYFMQLLANAKGDGYS